MFMKYKKTPPEKSRKTEQSFRVTLSIAIEKTFEKGFLFKGFIFFSC